MVVLYHRIFQAKVTDIFRELQSYSKAIAHPNAQVEEMERWLKEKQTLEAEQETLLADCLIYAAALSYFVVFPAHYRLRLITRCRKLCEENHLAPGHADRFDLSRCLTSSDTEVPSATVPGHLDLPPKESDWRFTAVSIKALAGPHSQRWPLILDPAHLARDWLAAAYRGQGVLAVPARGDPVRCVAALATAAAQGLAVLLTDIGSSIPPHCLPFLDRPRLSSTKKVTLPFSVLLAGATTAVVPVHPDFRLFLLAAEADPAALPPAACQLAAPVLAAPLAETIAALALPAFLALDDAALGKAFERDRAEEQLLVALLADTEAQCRAALFDPFVLAPLRQTFVLLSSKLEACRQRRQAQNHQLAPYLTTAETVAQLFMAVYHSPARCTLSQLLEVLQPILGERNGHPAGGDGEEDAVRTQALPQTIAAVAAKHFQGHLLLDWTLSVPLWPTEREEEEEDSLTLDKCLQWWPPSPAATQTAPLRVGDVAALLRVLPVDVSPSGEGLAAIRRIVQAQVQVLQKRPADVKGFVSLVQTLQQMICRLPFYLESMRKAHARVCIALAKAPSDSPCSPEEVNEAKDVARLAGELLAARQEAELFLQAATPAMLQQLQADAAALLKKADEAGTKVKGGDSEAAIVVLHEYKAEVDLLEAQVRAVAGEAADRLPVMAAVLLCRCRSDELSDTFASTG
eukprot:EG_transcript_4446